MPRKTPGPAWRIPVTGRALPWLAGVVLACLLPVSGWAQCRLALVLALDVSGSVDSTEYRLQLDGLAWALEQDEVRQALLAMPAAPVRLAVYEWSGRADQRLIADWREMRSVADVAAMTALLRATQRQETTVSTGIGAALLFGQAKLLQQKTCARAVVDLSGDGRSNDGPRPQDVRPNLAGTVVNALVVGAGYNQARGAMARETESLVRYYDQNVIHGPKAFVEIAQGYEDFAETMKRKLLRELRVMALSGAPSPDVENPTGRADRAINGKLGVPAHMQAMKDQSIATRIGSGPP